jgi:hypothetical protein
MVSLPQQLRRLRLGGRQDRRKGLPPIPSTSLSINLFMYKHLSMRVFPTVMNWLGGCRVLDTDRLAFTVGMSALHAWATVLAGVLLE